VQRVLEDPLDALPGVGCDEPQHDIARVPQVGRLQLHVDGRAADARGPLMHQDARMRQRPPLAGCARRQQELARAAGQSDRERRHVARHEAHEVAQRQHRRHRAARGVDPQGDVGCGIRGGERHELGGEQRAVVVVENAVEHEHALLVELTASGVGEADGAGFVAHAFSLRRGRDAWADIR